MKIVTISGLDGSGKSTQIEILKNYLARQGKKVFYFHAVRFGLANKLSGNNKVGELKSVAKANRLQIMLRKLFLRIDIWRFGKLYKKLKQAGFEYILSDRYFYDTIVNINYLEDKNLKFGNWKLIENLKLKIENCLYIYLNANPEIIMRRERQPDQGIEYLKKKKELYDKFSEKHNLIAIDGNQNTKEVFQEIKKLCQV